MLHYINSPDDGSSFTILIDEGIYHEKVVAERISPLTFTGVTSDVRNPSSNRVTIWQSTTLINTTLTTIAPTAMPSSSASATVPLLAPPISALTNINFVQRQFKDGQEVTQTQLGPAAALCVENSKASFYGCGFSSYQDTIYVGPGSQAYFFKSIVKGMTDYLYGMGKAWFEQVQLLNRACGGGITAWRGDAKDATVGVYVSNSSIDKSPDASTLKNMEGKCHLGRPWNQYANSVYLNTWMSSIVAPEGFRTWNKEATNFDPSATRFAEYKSSGPGGNMQDRDRQLEKILTEKEAKQITVQKVFGQTEWIDWETVKKW